MKELYQPILFDDGRAPKFNKSMLVVERDEINEIISKEVRLSSKNLR